MFAAIWFSIDDGGSRRLTLTWQPVKPGEMCEDMYLRLRGGRIRIIAHGHAGHGRKVSNLFKKILICSARCK